LFHFAPAAYAHILIAWTACVTVSMEPRTDQYSARRAILVVDTDVQIRRLLELSLRNAGFDVRAAATAPEALKAVGELAPDLIVSETRLEGGPDGFELCRQIKKRTEGPRIAFVFLAEQTVETKLRGVEAGADDFLAKPVYVQEVVAHARSLLQRRERDRLEALARGDERFVGELEDFPLVDLLGALAANHKSGVVVLTAPSGARGEIYFREGAVVDAEVGRLSGLDAVCRLFSWSRGRFEIEWKNIRRKDAVGKEPSALVVEALRRLDEWRRLLVDLPALETIFEVDYHLLAERLAEIPDEVNGVLRLFDGQRTFIHVIDDCGLSDLDALAVVGKLFREQIIRDARAKPDAVGSLGADIEGWLSDAAGPFRAPPPSPRRDLFGPSSEPAAGVHGRATAPVEPLEEAAREPVVAERRERFTDRLIAEGTAAAAAAAAESGPTMMPETTQLGVPALPAAPSVAVETTRQGLATAPLSTRPGFQAVTPSLASPARVARELPVDIATAVRSTPLGIPSVSDGVPQPLAPQSPEPAIVIPTAPGTTAPRLAAAPPVEATAPEPGEPRVVAGEILARAPTAKLFEPQAMMSLDEPPPVKRTTDLGLGPAPAEDVKSAGDAKLSDAKPRDAKPREAKPDEKTTDARAHAPTARAGEVVVGPARVEEVRPQRKIILDPEIPADEAQPSPGGAGGAKLLAVAAGFALAIGGVWLAVKKTGHKHPPESAVAVAVAVPAPVAPIITPLPSAGPNGPAASAGGASAASTPRAPVDPAREERFADPKIARALPTEFPQLLAACRQAFTEKRAKDAETACVAAKDANPDSPDACALLGHALFNRKKRREALQWAERAVLIDPRHADAYVIIGGVKQAADDRAGARAAYKKYLELAPHGQYAADLRDIVDSL
jgi:CheY-like chemotaxis protein